ncbi:type IX secretion system sortase PorU [Flavihumibacter rivuli]|uniref:type IX secretion system sortase PorU n=1 Tax=Flavihumibacter rivuli TaxID=2838156 RepID=UPI001BDE7C79|nr:type IX secretion system sortase PorU [Flavihumibacter rivuli]ULQ54945.1 type IX secretion system sortase PorU [Flavihumibacter rivuli]
MNLRFHLVALSVCITAFLPIRAQRSYADHSILASGNWYKVGVTRTGIYKLDLPLLQQLGISGTIPSAQLRLFGRRERMLPEPCAAPVTDDLVEMAIEVADGGDGVINGQDYILFYAQGADRWVADTLSRRFRYEKNLYGDTAFVFLTIQGNGKRILPAGTVSSQGTPVNTYQFRYHHELDSVNLLSSGKSWLGEPFNMATLSSRIFQVGIPEPGPGTEAIMVSKVAARSVGTTSSFLVRESGSDILAHTIPSVSSSNLDLIAREDNREVRFPAKPSISLEYRFQSANGSALGWLDQFDIYAQSGLALPASGQLPFSSWEAYGKNGPIDYIFGSLPNGARVWGVKDPLQPVDLPRSGADRFQAGEGGLGEYIAFSSQYFQPVPMGKVGNQDIHGEAIPEMIIVTVPQLELEARRLADWHQSRDGISSLVVTTSQVFNEFSGGIADPTAIRDMVKMFYDRAMGSQAREPRYLLLFGDASFDYKNRISSNTNLVPSYQSSISLDPLSTYTSDDYYGFLDDEDDINNALHLPMLEISIGRVPAASETQARAFVDKVIAYYAPSNRGSWRNQLSFIADDEDQNLHLRDAEEISKAANQANPMFGLQKIYLDAYDQESNASGSRYPAVNQAVSETMQEGTLIWNYSGHGGFRRLAEEVVLDKEIVDSWQQNGKLPLFITATCDFAPYDNPAIESLGEYLLLKPGAGGIALMTTTRLVFAFSNRIMNRNYLATALQPLPDGRFRSLGEATRDAKNLTYQNSGDLFNNRKFTLLGDPALTLSFPEHRVATLKINGRSIDSGADTIRALQKVTVDGVVTDKSGNPLTGFNGFVFPLVLDKPYDRQTRANDPGSLKENFKVQDRILFKGRATVQNGRFSFSFVVPKDINYEAGEARISYYATDSLSDASGVFAGLPIAGSVPPPPDREGPQIKAWLNDLQFRDGDLTNKQPILLLSLADTSGINVLGTGIGHDITATLEDGRVFTLNRFFEAETDTYQSGKVQFVLPELPEGKHRLRIKAWDVLNNSSEVVITFRVEQKAGFVLEKVYNYPNPTNAGTRFVFVHNQNGSPLRVQVNIYGINGQKVKTINGTIIASGNRSFIDYDGRNDRGFPLSPGIYVYQVVLQRPDGKQEWKAGKLVKH